MHHLERFLLKRGKHVHIHLLIKCGLALKQTLMNDECDDKKNIDE